MKDKQNFEERSRLPWFSMNEGGITSEQIGVGCLQRIATAMESLNRSWCSVQEQNVRYRERIKSLEKTNAALRGEITKMKKKVQL